MPRELPESLSLRLDFARRLHDGETASALWACHLASLLVGAGILLRRAGFVAIGVLWLLVGIPMWFVYLSIGGPFRPASVLHALGRTGGGLPGSCRFRHAATDVVEGDGGAIDSARRLAPGFRRRCST